MVRKKHTSGILNITQFEICIPFIATVSATPTTDLINGAVAKKFNGHEMELYLLGGSVVESPESDIFGDFTTIYAYMCQKLRLQV